MAWIEVGGIGIAYDVIGEGAETVAITPGGRFARDTPGVRPLAEKLAAAGKRALIWDRPNTGESDLCFAGETESFQNADALAGLLRALDFGPTYVVAGSGGSREALMTAIRHPEMVRRLFVLWISGGGVGLGSLPFSYCHQSAMMAAYGGMAAVAELPDWATQIARNPGNRDRLLAQDPMAFIAIMKRWAAAFFPGPDCPVPGITAAQLGALNIPVTVLRSGLSDVHHPRETSEAVHALIPGATLAEPPWGDREWIERLLNQGSGAGLFASWPMLAEQIVAFERG
ncbi:alpha/beta hydrolase [Sphingomonas naphthae]|uniref:Alpha/beta hydrolase n=1 Tax=Sphingomonas naphthae TaxID=1813468 RepID=A0ABY7TKX7_9SPHN|nr:alpha/beta hydrolase [Sphingomonas naphthae]WCT73030.1 alpha/beta hydrolase [Sphingomonas naphthae]